MSFDWSKLSEKAKNETYNYIMADPCDCDDCGDTYNRGDLLNHFGDKFLVCKNCINAYNHLFK